MSRTQKDKERESIGAKLTLPTVKVLIALVVLFVAQQIVLRVPAAAETTVALPETAIPISVARIMILIFTLIMILAIMNYAFNVGGILAKALPDFPKVRRIIQLMGAMLSTVIIYAQFRQDMTVHYSEYTQYYDIGFLIFGVLLVFWFGLVFYLNVDKISTVLKKGVEKTRQEQRKKAQADTGQEKQQ